MESQIKVNTHWILASGSPRRQELLQTLMHDFAIIPADIDENVEPKWAPQNVAENLAVQKSLAVSQDYPDSLVIGSDTVVRLENEIFGKPQSDDQVRSMLKSLSGQIHIVETGVCISLNSQIQHRFTESTQVFFKELSNSDITEYIESQEPFGKAGAYAIQGLGATFIEKINGCFYNVVGLPIFKLNKILELHNYERNRKSNALG